MQRTQVSVAWYNDPLTSNYWQGGGIGGSYYGLPQDYTIDGNSAPGGTRAPSDGWTTLVSVTSNDYAGRMHLVDLAGYNWIRINITATLGGNAAIKMDVYDASQLGNDSFLMLGDSITAEGTAHSNIDLSGPWNGGNLTQLINAANPSSYPLILDGGTGGVTAQWGATYISSLLQPYSGHYVALSYGTNDANQQGALSSEDVAAYYTNLLAMVDAVQARGMVPIVPHIPWGCDSGGWLGTNAKTLNDYVDAHLYNDRQGVIKGPDLWSYFYNHQSLIRDCIHPTYTESGGQLSGYEQYQRQWRDAIVANVYTAPAPTLSPTTLSFGNQLVNTTSTAQSVTLTNSGNAALTISSIGLSGTNTGDFAQTNTCPISPNPLAAGASCTISVTFKPTATGSRSANLSISDNAIGSPQTVSLSGTGTTGVAIVAGWNLIDVPVQGIPSASALVASMNAAGQLGSSAVTGLSTYSKGRFSLYVPGYSSDQALEPSQGTFVNSRVGGTWSPVGSAYTTGQPVSLTPGWNLVAAPYPVSGLSASTIAMQASACNVQGIVIMSGGSYQVWLPAVGGTLIVPNTSGMWIQCTGGMTWTPS